MAPQPSKAGRTCVERLAAAHSWHCALVLVLLVASAGDPTEGADLDCFPPDLPADYYECCRDVQSSGQPANPCFNEEFTFERCCTFRFGPLIRGLPYSCLQEPDGLALLDMGHAGRLALQCQPPAGSALAEASEVQPLGRETIYLLGFLAGMLLTNLPQAVEAARGPWPEGAAILEPLLGRPLRVLDSACGTGVTSIAAARVGHNVTAVDMSPTALTTTRRNARRNGVHVSTHLWDMLTKPGKVLQERGPFDIVYSALDDVVWIDSYSPGSSRDAGRAAEIIDMGVMNTLSLQVGTFVFVCYHESRRSSSRGQALAPQAVVIVEYLSKLGAQPAFRRPCGPQGELRCPRLPTVSPRGWISQAGLGPPTSHVYVLW